MLPRADNIHQFTSSSPTNKRKEGNDFVIYANHKMDHLLYEVYHPNLE